MVPSSISLIGILAAGVLLLLFVGCLGYVIWSLSTSKKTDFSSRYDDVADSEYSPQQAEKQPQGEALRRKFSSQGTVEATGDVSISSDDDGDAVLEKRKLSSQATVDSTGDASVSTDDEE